MSICAGNNRYDASRAGINRIRAAVVSELLSIVASRIRIANAAAARKASANRRGKIREARVGSSGARLRRARNKIHGTSFNDAFESLNCQSPEVVKWLGIRQRGICRLRLAPASGISASMELWPSG